MGEVNLGELQNMQYDVHQFTEGTTASDFWLNFFFVWATAVSVIALIWVFWKAIKHKEYLPLIAWIGGFIGSTNEGTIDLTGHLVWAKGFPLGVAYWHSGNAIPAFAPITYAFFVGLAGYFSYKQIQKGVTVKGFFKLFVLMSVMETVLELPATLTGCYIYDNEPLMFGGFPLWASWVNGFGYVLIGALMHHFIPILKKGWQKPLIALLVPFGHIASWAVILWPVYIGLNWTGPSEIPPIGQAILSLLSLGLAIIATYGIASTFATDSKTRLIRESDKKD